MERVISGLLKLIRPIKFAVVGGIGTILGLALFWLFNELLMAHYMISAFFSIELTILSNFGMNTLWTFRDRPAGSKQNIRRLVKYHMVSFGGMAIHLVALFAFVELLFIGEYIAYILAVIVAFFWNYSFSSRWAWKADLDDI